MVYLSDMSKVGDMIRQWTNELLQPSEYERVDDETIDWLGIDGLNPVGIRTNAGL